MTSSKASFYTNNLYIVLTAGEWTSQYPSKALNRSPLSWPELLRKFRKHCSHEHEIAEIASQTQALSLLLIRSQQTTPEAVDCDHTDPDVPLILGGECRLLEERKEEARVGYKALQALDKSQSVYLALAYYAFSLGHCDDVLNYLSNVNFDSFISPLNASNVGSVSTALSVPTTHESFSTLASVGTLDADTKEGKIWRITELIRGKCLQGMAHESLPRSSPSDALLSYESALPLLHSIAIPKSLPSTPGQVNLESFTRYRELWRWAERLLWRASVLSAKTQPIPKTHNLLRIYQTHSIHWPATFRPEHRSTIAQLHLQLLLRTYTPTNKNSWLNETRSIVNDYRMVLTATTTFPRARQRNVKVEEFVDLCMAAWEVMGASGEQTGWVIDILWWATRFTFNSPRIYRHLSRTLYVSGDTELSRRTLKLYVQVVSKARQTGACEEPDKLWVETLVQGARMLCRVPGGIEDATEAGELVRKAAALVDEHDKISAAAVKRVEGIWHVCMALREQDTQTRPEHLAASLTSLKESLSLHPTPSTHFHLALAHARPGPQRDLSTAVACAKEAVAGDPKEIRYFHLLGLLLAAIEDWKNAKVVLEWGAEIGDGDESDGAENSGRVSVNGHATTEEVPVREEGNVRREDDEPNGTTSPIHPLHEPLIPDDILCLPTASTLRRPIPDYPPPTKHERFEHALQLRLTQLALIEHVDGPENASAKWVEVFSWVAGRKGLGEERRSPSVEPPASEPEANPFEATAASRHSHVQPMTALTLSRSRSRSSQTEGQEVFSPIPINLIPPTPLVNGVDTDVRVSSERHEKQDKGLLEKGVRRDGDGEKDHTHTHDTSKGKKVQRILKERVHKGQAHINTISRKIGQKGSRTGMRLKRASSAPDFHAALSDSISKPYQASSIHSRQRLSASYMRATSPEPPAPAPASSQPQSQNQSGAFSGNYEHHSVSIFSGRHKQPSESSSRQLNNPNANTGIFAGRSARERRLLSNLWLTSAATFRRMGKIEQARGAIQEAEMADEKNEDVWVQLGLYFAALGETSQAISSFHKALFINPEHVPAFVHLTQQYLTEAPKAPMNASEQPGNSEDNAVKNSIATQDHTFQSHHTPTPSRDNIDLAAGLLSTLTRGLGWDVPEAWYFLARARGLQGKRESERECLGFALGLVEGRSVRDVAAAVGVCL